MRRVPEPVPPSKYSEVTLDGERVASFREKPADPRSDLSAIAVYLLPGDLPARVRAYLAEGGNPDAPGHLLAWLAARAPLEAVRLDGRWLDIGTPEDLERAGRDHAQLDGGKVLEQAEAGGAAVLGHGRASARADHYLAHRNVSCGNGAEPCSAWLSSVA